MTVNGEKVLEKALELPPMKRAELVENLLASFKFQSRKDKDALKEAWYEHCGKSTRE